MTPMTVGGSDQWPTNMYTDIIALRYTGDAASRACYYKTEGATFMTQDWLDGMNAFKELIDLGAFPADASSLTRDESEVAYFAGEIPMYVHGQWFAGSLSPEMQQKVKAVSSPPLPAKKPTTSGWAALQKVSALRPMPRIPMKRSSCASSWRKTCQERLYRWRGPSCLEV